MGASPSSSSPQPSSSSIATDTDATSNHTGKQTVHRITNIFQSLERRTLASASRADVPVNGFLEACGSTVRLYGELCVW